MTHELILTSVSQGLESNDLGFCLVAASGTPLPQLITSLKAISNYRHLFKPDSNDAFKNPVAYSHLIISVADTPTHVLSRTADSGVDFQHQPNRLVHHVAFQAEEQIPEGPAWILAQSGFHLTEWLTPAVRFFQGRPLPTLTGVPPMSRLLQIDREHRWLDVKKMEPFIDVPPPAVTELPPIGNTPCPCWKKLTGDAGWGGALAATVRTGRPAVLLFELGMNILPLFVESLALIPSSMRWKATFCTYFTDYPEDVTCQWKAVPAKSAEANRLQADPTVLLIDLTKPSPMAPNGPYVEFARFGRENTLPENERQAALFEDAPELIEESVVETVPEPTSTTEFAVPEPSNIVPSPVFEPPVIGPPPIRIQTSSPTTSSTVGTLINMRSSRTFYTIFVVTFFCVFLLSVLAADQLFGLGLVFAPPAKPVKKADVRSKKSSLPKVPPPKTEQEPQPGDTATVAEKQRQAKEQERQQRKENIEQTKRDLDERAKADREKLELFLQGFAPPKNLELRVVEAEDTEKSQRFTEFADLFPFGPAVRFELVPLLRNPRFRIETKKKACFLAEPSPTEETEEDEELPQEMDDAERMPDLNRFEWNVCAINDVTGLEVPLLLLRLTAEGLSVYWLNEATTPQYAGDVALFRFGFLRYYVDGTKDMTKMQSVPLFVTQDAEPIYPTGVFDDPEKKEHSVPTPLADEPWKSIVESPGVRDCFSLRLDVVVRPENLSDVSETKLFRESPDRIYVEMKTTVTSKRNEGGGRDSANPIVVSFGAVAEPGIIRWTDRMTDYREELNKELAEKQTQIKEVGEELEVIRKKILNLAGTRDPELTKRQRELVTLQRELEARRGEIESILSRLADAHAKVVRNKELRFEYSLFLLPKESEEESAPRLRNEESACLMKTAEGDGESGLVFRQ